MFKKIILIFCLIFLPFVWNTVFAWDPQAWWTALENLQKEWMWNGIDDWKTIEPKKLWDYDFSSLSDLPPLEGKGWAWTKEWNSSNSSWNWWATQTDPSQDITKETFTIDTDTFSVWWKNLKWATWKETINNTLWTFIKKLMIALWVISLLIMTIWAWYIILYHGEDEYLSKWKSIFKAWIISLVVSLSSYYIVNLIWYILYK